MRGYFLEQNDLSKMIKYTLAFNVDFVVRSNYVNAKITKSVSIRFHCFQTLLMTLKNNQVDMLKDIGLILFIISIYCIRM